MNWMLVYIRQLVMLMMTDAGTIRFIAHIVKNIAVTITMKMEPLLVAIGIKLSK